MKTHIGEDKDISLFHTVEITPSIGHNFSRASKLLQGVEELLYGAPFVKDLSSEL